MKLYCLKVLLMAQRKTQILYPFKTQNIRLVVPDNIVHLPSYLGDNQSVFLFSIGSNGITYEKYVYIRRPARNKDLRLEILSVNDEYMTTERIVFGLYEAIPRQST